MVTRQGPREAAQVLDETALLPLDPDQQIQGQAIVGGRDEGLPSGDVAVEPRIPEIRPDGGGRSQALERLGDAGQQGRNIISHTPLPIRQARIAKARSNA